MDFLQESHENVIVIFPEIESLDAMNSREFCQELDGILEENGCVVLNLSRINFIDSAGVAALITCLRNTENRSASLAICSVTPRVHELFQLVKMDQIFDMYPGEEGAVSALQKRHQ